MTTTIKQTEAAPESYPTIPTSPAILSDAAAALDPVFIWQRIESYVAHRWTERDVTWIVEGPGEWSPPLSPATISTVEIWAGDDWESVTPDAAPLGYWLPGAGPYRFTGTVGDDDADLPANVLEAFRRLAEYMAARAGKQGATREAVQAGSVSVTTSRSASWLAEALANSGAADLLRPYRRA